MTQKAAVNLEWHFQVLLEHRHQEKEQALTGGAVWLRTQREERTSQGHEDNGVRANKPEYKA
jgi:hypothetical protein